MLLMLPASPTYNVANYCKPAADHPHDYLTVVVVLRLWRSRATAVVSTLPT